MTVRSPRRLQHVRRARFVAALRSAPGAGDGRAGTRQPWANTGRLAEKQAHRSSQGSAGQTDSQSSEAPLKDYRNHITTSTYQY